METRAAALDKWKMNLWESWKIYLVRIFDSAVFLWIGQKLARYPWAVQFTREYIWALPSIMFILPLSKAMCAFVLHVQFVYIFYVLVKAGAYTYLLLAAVQGCCVSWFKQWHFFRTLVSQSCRLGTTAMYIFWRFGSVKPRSQWLQWAGQTFKDWHHLGKQWHARPERHCRRTPAKLERGRPSERLDGTFGATASAATSGITEAALAVPVVPDRLQHRVQPNEPHAASREPQASRVPRLSDDVQHAVQLGQPHAHAHGRETFQVRDVPHGVCRQGDAGEPPTNAHGRTAVPVPHLQQELHAQVCAAGPHDFPARKREYLVMK